MSAAALIVALLFAQVPCSPGELSVVCQCKQGVASACQVVRETYPRVFEELEKLREAAQGARVLLEGAKDEPASDAEAEARATSDAPDPPDCNGQEHHVISKRIFDALMLHGRLKGVYKLRDPRFVARAKNKESHCGYQKWHRDLDQEVANWLEEKSDATAEEFERYLRTLYSRPAMQARFPNGF